MAKKIRTLLRTSPASNFWENFSNREKISKILPMFCLFVDIWQLSLLNVLISFTAVE